MESIKPLPEAVQSAVRSGFIISDLPTVVEELVYNSLDAGATKVSVYVGVSNGYVKVEDDGSGISRDGLVLLGERYATSKLHHLQDKDDGAQTFGFRGEVLCSIAETSLIEIITKVHGRPNGYRKVMKGRKCLYLGIDDDRKDVGTTVIVRDLFYNQPVRRRQIQSSAKKVLHSVKNCAVRIALVQPSVSLKVVDMESEDELLRTHSSFSPLPILRSNFGFEASSLHELSFSRGSLKLQGYVSNPTSCSSVKAVQYIYVNSRFIVKGPIHKALNRLADMCWEQLSGRKGVKKGHAHTVPSYCLNLTCPRSCYDLNLEMSTTSVEFKDWVPVLNFIEKSVMTLWSMKNKGDSYSCEPDWTGTGGEATLIEKDWLLKSCQTPSKRRKLQNTHNEQLSAALTLGPMEKLAEDGRNSPFFQGIDIQGRNLLRNTGKFKAEKDGEFHYQKMASSERGGAGPSKYAFDIDKSINSLLEPSRALESLNEDLFENDVTKQKDDEYDDFFSHSRWEVGLAVEDANVRKSDGQGGWGFEFELQNDQLCSLSSEIQTAYINIKDNKTLGSQTKDCETNKICSGSDAKAEVHCLSHNFSYSQTSQSQHRVGRNWSLSKLCLESDIWEDPGITPIKRQKKLSFCNGSHDSEHSPDCMSEQARGFTPCFSPKANQRCRTSSPFLNDESWDVEHIIQDEGFERRSEVRNFDTFETCNGDEEFYHAGLSDNCSFEKSFAVHLDSYSVLKKSYAGSRKSNPEISPHEHIADDVGTIRYGKVFSDEPYSSCLDRREKRHRYSPLIFSSPSKSFNIEPQIDTRCEALTPDHTLRESWRGSINQSTSADLFAANSRDILADETFSPCLHVQKKNDTAFPPVSLISVDNSPKIDQGACQAPEKACSFSRQTERKSGRSKRSHSAPPIYRTRRRFFSIVDYLISTAESPAVWTAPRVCNMSERVEFKHTPDSLLYSSQHNQQQKMSSADDSLFCFGPLVKETLNITKISNRPLDGMTDTSSFSAGNLKPVRDSESMLMKWREEGFSDTRLVDIANYQGVGDGSNQPKDEEAILDVDSSMLNLAGDSLVPKSINRSCLESAKVLLQVDKKFIPVVAGGTLAVIDQHAADERIRLEEMRKKVLSGELKSITYLDEEKDLVLPEMAYQLLCNYAEHVKHWGWICNIFCQDSGSFNKNLNLLHGQPTHLSLLAVPCILGVNLSDADLLEFLGQLADTDGSSTIPPAVLRILNYKACRGAIMFGDRLLPSECNLIVEELKWTSLCFQCAHGRPTTVPLVNLEALHKGIAQLRSWHKTLENSWHGLCRKEISLERVKRRLNAARLHG